VSASWVALNAIAEHLDYGRRYTSRTKQIQRSFEDVTVKQRALDLVLAA
jgi:elongation factor P hydroxylase